MSSSWVTRWGYETAKSPTRPGVFRLKSGGFLVVAKAQGQRRLAPLHNASLVEAVAERQRLTVDRPSTSLPLFHVFATSLFEERILKGKINTASTRERWHGTLKDHLFPEFGNLTLDQVTHNRIANWTVQIARAKVAPSTANGWLRILRTICNVMATRFQLSPNPFDGVEMFPERSPYSPLAPNSLSPDVVRRWLETARDKYPQHYAMMMLGFITGRRPGELRAIRRNTDVLWNKGMIVISRSHGRGDQAEETTKQKEPVVVALPKAMMEILRDHVRALPPGPMRDSELLFPSETGGFRARSVLDKPFRAIRKALGLTFKVTPRAMRRSFQDLTREALVGDLVTRSISGHKTEKMQALYSTVREHEQRTALGKIVEMVVNDG